MSDKAASGSAEIRDLKGSGGAQHGQNSESFAKVGKEWEKRRPQEFTLAELLEYCRSCHRNAPFLFFNGNTFADIARTISDYLFAELPHALVLLKIERQ